MNKNDFIEIMKKEFGINDNQVEMLMTYKNYLQQQNKIHNLTRLDAEDLIYSDYFYNSVFPYKNLDWNQITTVLDVGSGSGIPGIVLKIIYPKIKLTIVESSNKKIKFMQELCTLLNLSDVNFINERAEKLDKQYRDYFDLVTARAVAELSIILELLIPYMKDDGICVLPKGKKVNDEMQNAKEIIRKLKIELFQKEKYMNINGYEEYILLFKKKDKTPTIYPREWKSIINNN